MAGHSELDRAGEDGTAVRTTRQRVPRAARVVLAALGGPALAGAVALLLAPAPWGPLTLGGEDGTRTFRYCAAPPSGGDLHDGQVVLDPGPGRTVRVEGVSLLAAHDLRLVEASVAPEQVTPDGTVEIPGTGPGWPPATPGLEPAIGADVGPGAGRRALVLRLRTTGPEPRYSGVRVDYTWKGRARYAVTAGELELRARCS